MEEKECLIYYLGGIGELEKHCRDIEDMGFAYIKKLSIESLDYEVIKCSYHGSDIKKDIISAESLDNKIRIEINKKVDVIF